VECGLDVCALTKSGEITCEDWEKTRPIDEMLSVSTADQTAGPKLSGLVVNQPYSIGSGEGWLSLSHKERNGCAIRRDGSLWCWNSDWLSQREDDEGKPLHRPRLIRRHEFVQVSDKQDWRSVSTGGRHACALDKNGHVWCWGENNFGQLDMFTRPPKSEWDWNETFIPHDWVGTPKKIEPIEMQK